MTALPAEPAPVETNEAVHQLAGVIARELDKLLTLILGYTELAVQDVDERAELLGDLGVVRRSTERARRLSDGLHTLSLRRTMHPVHVDLRSWLATETSTLEQLGGPHVTVRTRVDADAAVTIDPDQLEMIVGQLVRNAVESYDGPGTVTVSVRRRQRPDGDCVSIGVHDQGRGMDASTLHRCVDAFVTTKAAPDAQGLGLAVARIATMQAGGQLRLASRPGRGTVATVVLPAA